MTNRFHISFPPLRQKLKVSSPEKTAELECATEMCNHMKQGLPHPQLMMNARGVQFWLYEDRSYEMRMN